MDKITLHLKADEQILTSAECPFKLASNTVSYVEAVFELGENWTGYDSVRAVWFTYFDTIATVLDNEGKCIVPHEVLVKTDKVMVNLVGSIAEDGELTDRLTTYPTVALNVNADAYVEGTETAPITPSQFEQYVADVAEEVAKIKDIESTTLNDDYTLTFVFSDGTSTTVGPIRGEQGPQGETGPQGPEGPPGEVTMAQFESAFPTDTASGAIASFPDGSDLFPAKSLVAEINPIQDTSGGDPSPSNICPISGWDSVGVVELGRNLYDFATSVAGYVSSNGSVVSAGAYKASDYIPINPSTPFTFSLKRVDATVTGAYGMRIAWYDANKTFIQRDGTDNEGTSAGVKQTTATAPANAKYARVSSAYTADKITDFQFEVGSTATSYEAYNPTNYTSTLPSTTYGGSVDLVSGELTVTHAILDLGDYNWDYNASYGSGGGAFYTQDILMPYVADSSAPNAICSNYKVVSRNTLYNSADANLCYSGSGQRRYITVRDNRYSDSATFKTAMAGVQFCYELASPTTVQLTAKTIAILKATNNIFADSGDVEVEYKADVQLWVEKKLSE